MSRRALPWQDSRSTAGEVASGVGAAPRVGKAKKKRLSTDRPIQIDIAKILEILPHRYPFVMVDRVTEIIPRASIRGHKMVSYNEPWSTGHFPGRPILPGVLIIESLAQIGGILAYASEPFDSTTSLMYFLGIDKAKFRRTVHREIGSICSSRSFTTVRTCGSCVAKPPSTARCAPKVSFWRRSSIAKFDA